MAGDNVLDYEINEDKTIVVYIQGTTSLSSLNILYSASIVGGNPPVALITFPITSNMGVVDSFRISGDNVVYATFHQVSATNTIFEIYSVPISGGSAVKLNGELVAGGSVIGWGISNDNVLYLADQDTDNVFELYSVPIGGGDSVKLNSELAEGGNVGGIFLFNVVEIAGDHVVYRADQDTAGVVELYSVPITGGTDTKLNGDLVEGGDVSSFRVAGDNVVYLADQDTAGVIELYSVPITGGTAVKLNGELAASESIARGDDRFGRFVISDDNVVYLTDQDTFGVFELYNVPIRGGTAVKLNSELAASESIVRDGGRFGRFVISDDNVVYLADQDTFGVFELYSVPIRGGTAVKLNSDLVEGGDVSSFRIAGDNVVYLADQDTNEVFEIYSTSISGDTAVKLNSDLVASESVNAFVIAGDNVVYLADQDTAGIVELYSVSISGGVITKLNGNLVAGGAVDLFVIAGANVLYRADEDIAGVVELYSVSIDGGPPTIPSKSSSGCTLATSNKGIDPMFYLLAILALFGLFRKRISS